MNNNKQQQKQHKTHNKTCSSHKKVRQKTTQQKHQKKIHQRSKRAETKTSNSSPRTTKTTKKRYTGKNIKNPTTMFIHDTILMSFYNCRNLYRVDSTYKNSREAFRYIDNDFVDIGVLVETKMPKHLPKEIAEEEMSIFKCINNASATTLGGGVMVYFDENDFDVSNIISSNDFDQIDCHVSYKESSEFEFDLCAFYCRPAAGLPEFRAKHLQDMVNTWAPKIENENSNFFAVGDINADLPTNNDNEIIDYKCKRSHGPFKNLITFNKCKQMSPLNTNHLDVFIRVAQMPNVLKFAAPNR